MSNINVDIIIILAIALVLLIMVHILLARLVFKDDIGFGPIFYLVILAGGNVILVSIFTSVYLHNPQYMYGLVYLFIVLNSMAYIYFHIYNMSETSVRIKILSLIYTGTFYKNESLSKVYTYNVLVENRLNRLVNLNQIENVNGYYRIKNSALLRIADLLLAFKKLIAIK